MPVYVYRNLTTGETFEIEQRMVDPALVTHPTTGDPVKRLIQPVGIAFKGSGFYVTDSRSKSTRGASASAEAKGGDGDGASDAKPSTGDGAAVTEKKDGGATKGKEASTPATPATPAPKAPSSSRAAD